MSCVLECVLLVDCCMLVVIGVVGICSQWLLQCRWESFFSDISVSTWRLYVPVVTSLWLFLHSLHHQWHLCAPLMSTWHCSKLWSHFDIGVLPYTPDKSFLAESHDSYSLHSWSSCVISEKYWMCLHYFICLQLPWTESNICRRLGLCWMLACQHERDWHADLPSLSLRWETDSWLICS